MDVTLDELERGRAFFERRAWTDAYASLARGDREGALEPEDLELLAPAAYMVGRDEEQQGALERAHRGYLDRGEPLAGVRCAAGDGERARATSAELDEIAMRRGSTMLHAQAAQARGAVRLVASEPSVALKDLRQAWRLGRERPGAGGTNRPRPPKHRAATSSPLRQWRR